jgi:hypothetical protein
VYTAVFYSLSTVCQYLTLYRSSILFPLLSSRVCPLSVSTSLSNVLWFCFTMSTAVFYSPLSVSTSHNTFRWLCPVLSSTVCPLSVSTSHCNVLRFFFYCCLLLSVQCLSVFRNLRSIGSASTAVFYSLSTVCQYFALYCPPVLYPLLSTIVCPLSVSILHCTVRWFRIYCCLLQSVRSLSVRHTPLADCRPSAYCTAAVTPSATSQRQL